MIDNNHPITPPPELVQQWLEEWAKVRELTGNEDVPFYNYLATKASCWGWQQRDASVPNELQEARDEELEACCEWVGDGRRENLSQVIALRAARRPKPPSLKERIATAIAHGDTSIALALLDQALPK